MDLLCTSLQNNAHTIITCTSSSWKVDIAIIQVLQWSYLLDLDPNMPKTICKWRGKLRQVPANPSLAENSIIQVEKSSESDLFLLSILPFPPSPSLCLLLCSFLISSWIPSIFDPNNFSSNASILVWNKTSPKVWSSSIVCITCRRVGVIFVISTFKPLMIDVRLATWRGIPVSLTLKLPSLKGTLTLIYCQLSTSSEDV